MDVESQVGGRVICMIGCVLGRASYLASLADAVKVLHCCVCSFNGSGHGTANPASDPSKLEFLFLHEKGQMCSGLDCFAIHER